jgi:hypothetical protein
MFSVYDRFGQVYFLTTLVTAATGLFIFQHGGFLPAARPVDPDYPRLAAGTVTEKTQLVGGWSRYFQALCYSTTLFFHAISGVTETLTRLPPGKPIASGADDPHLQPIAGAIFLPT